MPIRFLRPSGNAELPETLRGLNLLGHAQLEELDIGSRCGGHGICGGDRVKVRVSDFAKLSPPTEAERKHLSAAQLREGWRLACQCWPSDDGAQLEVEAPYRWREAPDARASTPGRSEEE
jgi:ferredoxin